MASEAKFPEPALQDGRFSWLSGIQVAEDERTLPVLSYYLQGKIRSAALDLETLKEQVLSDAWNLMESRAENREKSIRALAKFINGWARNLKNIEWRQSRWKARS
jgi:hypothetical protein